MSDFNFCKNCRKPVGITDDLRCANCGEFICLVCGCTESAACEGGCYWARPGVCSECASVSRGTNDAQRQATATDILQTAKADVAALDDDSQIEWLGWQANQEINKLFFCVEHFIRTKFFCVHKVNGAGERGIVVAAVGTKADVLLDTLIEMKLVREIEADPELRNVTDLSEEKETVS